MTDDPRRIVDELEARILSDGIAAESDASSDEEQSAPVAEDVSPLTPYIEPTD